MTPMEYYQETLYIYSADTASAREISYHIRYQVYCQEFAYEPLSDQMIEREVDEYDAQSRHCLLVHKASNRPIGSARLIEVDPQQPDGPLPFWKHCPQAVDTSMFNPASFEPGQLVEFSRIAIIEEFRRRKKVVGVKAKFSTSEMEERRYSNFPLIPLCLCLAALSMLLDTEAEYGVAMMEPKLVRLLRKYGIVFESVGKAVEYHGLRGPYIIHRDNVQRFLTDDVDDLFLEIHHGLQQKLATG